MAIRHQDVLQQTRLWTIWILAFQADCIVACGNGAVRHRDVLTSGDIDPVRIGTSDRILDGDPVNIHVVAIHNPQRPSGRVLNLDILDLESRAVHELEHRTRAAAFSHCQIVRSHIGPLLILRKRGLPEGSQNADPCPSIRPGPERTTSSAFIAKIRCRGFPAFPEVAS